MQRHLSLGLISRSGTHVEQVLRPLQTIREGFQAAVAGSPA